MQRFFLIKHYLRYLFFAHHDEGHGVHSPFVYQFIQNVLEDERFFYAYNAIEERRARLVRDKRKIRIKDLGAGSHNGKKRMIKQIARQSAISAKYGELLFKLVDQFGARTIFELGTSIGLSTAYLAAANSKSKVFTFEGCPKTADIAKETLVGLNLHNVNLHVGSFESLVPAELSKNPQVDLVFFDGNHTYKATKQYFEWFLQKKTPDSIFVFDDIHWSPGMLKAWKEIKSHSEVVLTMDLFFIGIVFFRQGMAKQDIVIRY